MKNLFAPRGYVVKSNRQGSSLLNLSDGSRRDYRGDQEAGTLLLKNSLFSRARVAGVETNVHHLTALHSAFQPSIRQREEKLAQAMAEGQAKDLRASARRDLTDLPTFTIDSEESRDLDDALSARAEDGGHRVWVHIADVSSLVPEGSLLDRGARRRLTSLYLPDGSLPMFPRSLSEGCFSLLPGMERPVFTFEFLLVEGQIVESKLYPALIRSDSKLTYKQVTAFLQSKGDLPEVVRSSVEAARDGIQLDVNFTEESRDYRFLLEAEEGVVSGYSTATTGPSNKLIERYMVMANTEAGRILQEKNLPGVFRVHSLVDEEKRDVALAKVRSLFPLPEGCSFEEAQALVEESSDPRREVLLKFLLHTTPPAVYSTESGAHGGLGVEHYAHFTSPIRRYADLLNHRQLYSALGLGDAVAPRRLARTVVAINETNRRAKKLDRLMGDIFLNSHLQHSMGGGAYRGKVKARIEGFGPSGAFCDFGHGKNGFLFIDQLGPGELNEELTIFTGKYRTVVVGDTIPVTVGRPDLARGRVSLRFYRERKNSRRK